jgi:hypothetical protein
MLTNVTLDVAQIDADWLLAKEDSGLPDEQCLLVLLDRPPSPEAEDSLLLDPGFRVELPNVEPISRTQAAYLNAPDQIDGFRVLLADPGYRAARLGLLRDALEHGRQWRYDAQMYKLGGALNDALNSVYGGTGRGAASITRLHPMWSDAAAAGAALARAHAVDEMQGANMWGPYGGLLRTGWALEPVETLPERMLVWAALHRDAVEAYARDECGQRVEEVLESWRPDLVAAWHALSADKRLAQLGRAARVSIPSGAVIDAASFYPAAAWDRVLELLDRGMTLGRRIVGLS